MFHPLNVLNNLVGTCGFLIVDSRHGLFDRLDYGAMVTSNNPIIQHYTPRGHARVGDRSAYVTLESDACLDSTTSATQLAMQTHASPHVAITNGTDSYHRNQQYSVAAVTTSTGSIAERYAYSAYGQPTILDASGSVLSASAILNRYTYTGREWDATLGLHHFRARWMSPSAGRFLTRDPIGYIDGLNQFSILGTRPLSRLDSEGTCPDDKKTEVPFPENPKGCEGFCIGAPESGGILELTEANCSITKFESDPNNSNFCPSPANTGDGCKMLIKQLNDVQEKARKEKKKKGWSFNLCGKCTCDWDKGTWFTEADGDLTLRFEENWVGQEIELGILGVVKCRYRLSGSITVTVKNGTVVLAPCKTKELKKK